MRISRAEASPQARNNRACRTSRGPAPPTRLGRCYNGGNALANRGLYTPAAAANANANADAGQLRNTDPAKPPRQRQLRSTQGPLAPQARLRHAAVPLPSEASWRAVG